MLKSKFQTSTYNDGVAYIYEATDEWREAGTDYSKSDKLAAAACPVLDYAALSARQQDIELADAEGFKLTRKIRVRKAPGVDHESIIGIGSDLYTLGYIDWAQDSAYLYLEGLAVDGTVVPQEHVGGYDEIANPVDTWEPLTPIWCRRRSWAESRNPGAPMDVMEPTLTFTVRACDWDGYRRVTRDGVPYTVESTASHGMWVDVTATRHEGE